MKRGVLVYLGIVVLFVAGIAVLLHEGQKLTPPGVGAVPSLIARPPSGATRDSGSLWSMVGENLKDPLSRLLLQIIIVVTATRWVGGIFRRFGQPAVVGEVFAGILLGPSLLGWLWPEASGFLFPKESMGTLKLFSQIGVCLFMFVVGLELDVAHLRQKPHAAIMVSHTSILFPFFLGVGSALFLFSDYSAPGSSFLSFGLFMGIALSITAFPVLARILTERGISKTYLGSTAITCAAVDDATAWAILAFVVAIARASSLASTAFCLGLVIVFVAVMFKWVRPRLPGWLAVNGNHAPVPTRAALGGVLLILLLSALTTELIGIHALFGAFVAGVIMPQKKEFRESLSVRLESFSSLFLLPLFFAFSGLRTQVGLLNDPVSWLVCFAIIGVATLGKLGGSMIAARITGMTWNDSFALGALMNTRGLVELVALNIGYDLGILPPRIFAMLVLMALVTTFLTGPLLTLAENARRREPATSARSEFLGA